jgi:CTP-dependent riboflavin kinase
METKTDYEFRRIYNNTTNSDEYLDLCIEFLEEVGIHKNVWRAHSMNGTFLCVADTKEQLIAKLTNEVRKYFEEDKKYKLKYEDYKKFCEKNK